MIDRPVPGEGLSADVRAMLIQVLTTELADMWSSAVAAGGDTRQLIETVDRRQRLLAATRSRDSLEVRQ